MIEATSASFDAQVLDSTVPVLVDFWAPWCGPCKTLTPTFEALAAEYEGRVKFVKVNVDDTDIGQRYGVRGIPTLMLFKDGEVVSTRVGAATKSQIALLVDENI